MAECGICGKMRVIGNNVSHANNRTKRKVFPNLQKTKAILDGRRQKAYVCTRCLRSGFVRKAV